MGVEDQAENKAQEFAGKARDVIGHAAGDDNLRAEGRVDQATANARQAGEQARGAVKDAAGQVGDAVAKGHGVVNRLSRAGFRSEWAYVGAFASIGISLASWIAASRNKIGDSKSPSDRWGIFIGQWAPTFMVLGVALKLEEDH